MFETNTGKGLDSVKNKLIPLPQRIEEYEKEVCIGSLSHGKFSFVCEACDSDVFYEGTELLKSKFEDICAIDIDEADGDYRIVLKTDSHSKRFKGLPESESYYISIDEKEAVLCGADAAGAFYAVITFLSLLIIKNSNIYIPSLFILDYPDVAQRGMFMECRFGTDFMTLENWKLLIDYMASMKLNRLTVGLYGCWEIQYDNTPSEYMYVPFRKYQELKTAKSIKYYSVKEKKWIVRKNVLPTMYEKDFLGEIIAYGKRKNVSVLPLFNSLGHNTLIPRGIPEISAKDENGNPKGYGFCTRNEKTYEFLFDIYDEIIDRYLTVNGTDSFHIGIDEVKDCYICHCEKCRNEEHSELVTEFVIRLCRHLKSRGMKSIYIYHDMFFNKFKMINEKLMQRFKEEGIYDEVVFDWWDYDDPKNMFFGRMDEINSIFRSIIKPSTGYYHWTIPTENNDNIRCCASLARKHNFEAIEAYSSFDFGYDKNYHTLADVSWNASQADNSDEFDKRYARKNYGTDSEDAAVALGCMHDIMMDETRGWYINRICYRFEYYFYSYFSAQKYPRNFPGSVYKLLLEDGEEYVSYLRYVKSKAETALKFFASDKREYGYINDVWKLSAMHHYVLCDEYLTLLSLNEDFHSGRIDAYGFVEALERLIGQREELMILAEQVKIETNLYVYLRNMSVFRQYLLDLRDYFVRETDSGRTPVLDLKNLEYTASDIYYYIR